MKTGTTVEDLEWAKYLYVPYSDVYHTQHECPHIKDSENLVGGTTLMDLNGPLRGGAERVFGGGEEMTEKHAASKCSWCEENSEDLDKKSDED